MGVLVGIILAVMLHVGFIAFGGWFFLSDEEDEGTLQKVELISVAEAEEEEKKTEEEEVELEKTEVAEELEAEDEPPPDAAEMMRNLELSQTPVVPELEAASLSAIEAALSGLAGSSDFAQAVDFSSGGRIGGTGKVGEIGGSFEEAFSLADIDQQPRALFQAQPNYPASMRGKKVEGVVTVLFVVDETGKVTTTRVEKSTHEAFNKPAVDAVKKWKFEPAVRAGQRVPWKMSIAIRFKTPS